MRNPNCLGGDGGEALVTRKASLPLLMIVMTWLEPRKMTKSGSRTSRISSGNSEREEGHNCVEICNV
jgi:hypothetical protein